MENFRGSLVGQLTENDDDLEEATFSETIKNGFETGPAASSKSPRRPRKTFSMESEKGRTDSDWMSQVMDKPRHFTGARPASCIAQVEKYLEQRIEDCKMITAVSYPDERMMDRDAIALSKEEGPENWEEFEGTWLR